VVPVTNPVTYPELAQRGFQVSDFGLRSGLGFRFLPQLGLARRRRFLYNLTRYAHEKSWFMRDNSISLQIDTDEHR